MFQIVFLVVSRGQGYVIPTRHSNIGNNSSNGQHGLFREAPRFSTECYRDFFLDSALVPYFVCDS